MWIVAWLISYSYKQYSKIIMAYKVVHITTEKQLAYQDCSTAYKHYFMAFKVVHVIKYCCTHGLQHSLQNSRPYIKNYYHGIKESAYD